MSFALREAISHCLFKDDKLFNESSDSRPLLLDGPILSLASQHCLALHQPGSFFVPCFAQEGGSIQAPPTGEGQDELDQADADGDGDIVALQVIDEEF